MFQADGLLLIQGSTCNNQIPAKVYEYMRVGKPLLALTDPAGDTARLLKSTGFGSIVANDSTSDIVRGLTDFISQIRNGTALLPGADVTSRYARESASRSLAELLDSVVRRG